ncbi:MAG: signal peptidase II [Faecalibacterium sp.]
MFYYVINVLLIAVLVGIDQVIKLWAVNVLEPVGAMPLIPHVVELNFVLNPGMAFSLLSGKQTFLILATSIAMLVMLYWLLFRCQNDRLQQAAFVLIIGGGIGNLIDRVLNGVVVDYINLLFMDFAVFNFADICVCVGVGLWILDILLEGPGDDAPAGKKMEHKEL